MNFDAWRPFIAKFIAPLVGFAVTWLNKKFGIELGQDDQNQALVALVDFVVFAISTGLAGVGINKVVNPGNAASSHLAAVEKSEVEQIKRSEDGITLDYVLHRILGSDKGRPTS
jgi:hypothetical protein